MLVLPTTLLKSISLPPSQPSSRPSRAGPNEPLPHRIHGDTDERAAQIQATCEVKVLLRGGESQKQEVRGNETGQTWSVSLSDNQFPFF